ncbi:MAG: hypothetical protein QOJ98_1589, partial [Acidobacteriota bacterium]|nr:hypothetical protein [Acidobacteriota bacterium]
MHKILFVWLLAFAAIGAEARELYWRELAVRAQLQDDGTLRVEERQAMVFTGDWNGGERIFRVEPHQRLTIHGMKRGEVPMEEGSLDTVDRYAMSDEHTLRWRSREPISPQFDKTELVYTIDYSLQNVLVPDADPRSRRYTLDHDFAFTDREGVIERFSLELTLGDAWHSADGRVLRRQAKNLLPGESVVVTLPLEFRGDAAPSAMGYMTAMGKRLNKGLVPIPMLIALALFLWRERRRNVSIEIDRNKVDAAWLERNVLRHRPEVAGVFLHGDVGPPVVAALFARMEQEGKIRTWVTNPKRGKPILHLELLVPHEDLRDAEHTLARNLFLTHTETNTETIKHAYRKSGFDPPSIVRSDVLKEA